MSNKSLLFVCRHAPYGNSLAREALEAILAAGSFEQNVSVLFMDDGVLQLITGQQPDAIEQKNHESMLNALPMYDVERLYADTDALARYKLGDSLRDGVTTVSNSDIQQLFQQHDHILSF